MTLRNFENLCNLRSNRLISRLKVFRNMLWEDVLTFSAVQTSETVFIFHSQRAALVEKQANAV